MEKIIVDFKEVRGLGNIISPKTLSDFEKYRCDIVNEPDIVAGASSTVYRMNFNGTTFLVTVSSSYVHTGDTMTVTVTITDENGDPVGDASVELYKETTE